MDTNDSGTKKEIRTVGKRREKKTRRAKKETEVKVILKLYKYVYLYISIDLSSIAWSITIYFCLEEGKEDRTHTLMKRYKIKTKLYKCEVRLSECWVKHALSTQVLTSLLFVQNIIVKPLFLIPFYLLVVFF